MTPSTHPQPDTALLAASQSGEIKAFEQIVDRYKNLVCAVAYSRTGDRLLAEDVGQETFLAAWRQLDTLRDPNRLRSWLCGIARNLAAKISRSRSREAITEGLDAETDDRPSALEAILSREQAEIVWLALEQLPEQVREPLVLFYREEMSVKQVALGLGLSEAAAKKRLSRGRRALKDGVSDLVERVLESGRPSKGFTAAIVVAIAAIGAGESAAGSSTAGSSTAGSSTAGDGSAAAGASAALIAAGPSRSLVVAVAAAGAIAAAIAAAILVLRSRRADPEAPTTTDAAIVARLKHHRIAAVDPAARCRLSGRVSTGPGAIAGASIAVIEHTIAASSLDPAVIESAADGSWELDGLVPGSYTISIVAPGHLASTAAARCDAAGSAPIATALVAGGVLLEGTVRDVGGGPIAAATVWLMPRLGGDPFATRTDAAGHFEISAAPDRYQLVAIHPDYVTDLRPLELSRRRREDFTLVPGAIVEGIAIDAETGEPIGGARISQRLDPLADQRWSFSRAMSSFAPPVADAAGRFRLTSLPPGETALVASAPGWVSASPVIARIGIGETASGVSIPMIRGYRISGFVVDRERPSEGVAEMAVVAQADSAPTQPAIARTDAAGYFELTGLGRGDYRLSVAGANAAGRIWVDRVTIEDRDQGDRLLRFDRGAAVSGRIVGAPRASIWLERATADPIEAASATVARAELDGAGGFRFPAVEPGSYEVVAETVDGIGRTPINVAAAGVDGVEVVIRPGSSIAGIVVDRSGAAVAKALVAAGSGAESRSARTGEDGSFEIVGLAAEPHELAVFTGRGQLPWADDSDEPFARRTVQPGGELRLAVDSTGRSLSGVVVDSDGGAVADAWVEVRASRSVSLPFGYRTIPVLTGDDGRFEIAGVGGELMIEARGPRGVLAAPPRPVTGDSDITLELVALVTVTLTASRDGVAVDDFDVGVRGGPTEVIGRMLEPRDGAITLERLAPGTYAVEVRSSRGYARRALEVGGGAPAAVDIALLPTASIRGVLVDADGAPVKDASVMVSGVVLDMELADRMVGDEVPETGADGRFEIFGLIGGRGKLTVMRSTGYDLIAFVDVALEAGEQLDLGTVTIGGARGAGDRPFTDRSDDLGLRFFVGSGPPTDADLAALDASSDPESLVDRDGTGLWIAEVIAGGHGARAGLRRGDQITAVGTMRIGDAYKPDAAMRSLSSQWRSRGRAVRWRLRRHGRDIEVSVLVPREQP